MARPFKYYLYLVGLCFLAIPPLQAQYSEQTLIKEANELFDQGLYADAMPKYAQLLSLNPTSPELNYKYGATSLYGDASKKEEASKYLKFAVGKPGVDPLSWYFLGRAYHLNYQFADAIKAYEKYVSLVSSKDAGDKNLQLQLDACKSGQNLLSNIKEVVVLDKKQSQADFFFRLYDLSDIGGKILVTPEELLSAVDKKKNHKSLIHFRGIGTTVYFSSYGKDGKNGLDIYQAEVLPDGKFSSPVAITGGVNTPHDEDYPFMHPDNKTFYFSSKGHNSMGGYDVFRSAFDRNQGVFSKPENLDFAVNTPDDDIFYIADSLNNIANFASARSSKQGEMHVYKVEVKALPLELTVLKGNFANKIETTNRAAKITVLNAATNKQVDVQYTDPGTGDYVLSFPKSGRYKFLVEAKNSTMVHSGLVDVPTSDGISAYIQEMELIQSAGVEKLLINNLFDQQYEGDIAELMQNLLRQKAALEVNFNDVERPVEAEAPIEVDKFSLAYNEAGFGAGLSNEKVLEQAEKRVSEYSNSRLEIERYIGAAAAQSVALTMIAEKEIANASKIMKEANDANGEQRDKLMFEAATAKFKANNAIISAQNARKLEEKLIAYEKTARKKFEQSRGQVDSLEAAINSGEYDAALAALKRENDLRTSLDKVTDRFDPVGEVRTASSSAQNDARRKMEGAMNLREEAETLQGQWLTKKRQREKLTGKQGEKLDQEISLLATDIADLRMAASKAFDEAEKYQVKARNEQEQYELLSAMRDGGSAEKSGTPSAAGSDEKLKALQEKSKSIDPDRASVANYIAKNPQSISVFEGDRSEMAFKKLYAAEPIVDGEIADNGSVQVENTIVGETAGDKEKPSDATESTDIALVNGQDKPGQSAQINTETGRSSNSADQSPVKPSMNLSETGQSLSPGVAASKIIESKTPDQEIVGQNVVKQSVAEKGPIEEAPRLESENNTLKSEHIAAMTAPVALPSPGTPEADQRIQAERIKIQSSEDWIAIIDESIDELEQGVGGDESNEEDVQAQLEQYRQLKEAKMYEVEAGKRLIAELSMESASPTNAMERAEQDIDTLDASFVARLESRISDAYVQGGYVAAIKSVNREYLSEMAAIEMSGESTPEIVTRRIALNENLVAGLDKVISKEVYAELNDVEALELRRIKTLEIQMDREILEGLLQFEPRTAEAAEYRNLLAGKDAGTSKSGVKEKSNLSPKLTESISRPYSRDLILPGYGAKLGASLNKNAEDEKLESRIEVNGSFVGAIDREIAQIEKAVDAIDGPIPVELNDRHQLLLLERANASDQVEADQQTLSAIRASSEVSSEPAIEASSFEIPTTDYEAAFVDQVDMVKAKNLSESNELKSLADLNRRLNQDINREIDMLMPALDATTSDFVRDAIQLRIQHLDALAADKLQEADRLETEADVLLSSTVMSAPVETAPDKDQVALKTELTQDISPDELKFSIDQTPDYQFMEYKSLNANIQYSQLQASIDSANTYRGRAKEILSEYNAEKNPKKRAALYDEFAEVSQRITSIDKRANQEISISNKSEIDFYKNAGQQLSSRLASLELEDDAKSALDTLQAEMNSAQTLIESNRALLESLDPTETASRAALLAEERALIRELGSAYTAISEIERGVEASHSSKELEAENKGVKDDISADSGFLEGDAAAATDMNQQALIAELPSDSASTRVLGSTEPLPGKMYVTPMSQKYVSSLSEQELADMSARNPELKMPFNLSDSDKDDQWSELIPSMTAIDAQGLKILRQSPEKLRYMSAVIAADTLRTLENEKVNYAERISSSAESQLREADRLKEMIKYQNSASDKEFLAKKAAKLSAEAEVSYKNSAIATAQAEEIRTARIAQEQRIASSMKMLATNDLAELNSFVDLPVYNVVQMDLTSEEPLATASNVRTGRKPDAKENLARIPAISKAASENVDVEPISSPVSRPTNDANWLAMVEIVAEKKDFSDVKETMFVSVDAPVYNESNPIPIDPEMPSGLIFQVQVGAFRNPIPAEHFGEFAPVMGQRIGNGITRYRAGIFRKYKEAIVARNGIRAKGYSDAFVVAYLNGEKLTGTQAEQILAQARLAENFSIGDELALTSAKASANVSSGSSSASSEVSPSALARAAKAEYYNDPEAAEAVQVEVVSGLFFTVQVGVYSKPVKLAGLYNLTNLNSELTAGGMIRYTTGRFSSVADAGYWKQEAINTGVTDAFITAYNNGIRISLQEAEALLNANGPEALSPEVRKP